jgi:hypothetical protein
MLAHVNYLKFSENLGIRTFGMALRELRSTSYHMILYVLRMELI